MEYIWQQKEFPNFSYQKNKIIPIIEDFTLLLGEVSGVMKTFSQKISEDIFSELMLSEAIKTSAIEGEYFNREDVMSSIKMNLGIESYRMSSKSKKADAIAHLMIQIRRDIHIPLSTNLLKEWHKILMQNESGIRAGKFRKGNEPMNIISGRYGNIKIHYQAPASKHLPLLMNEFINWMNVFDEKNLGKIGNSMLLSSLSHLYFETLHPFEDGNGRIGRALAEKVLAQKLQIPLCISISKAIEKDKKRYYSELKKAQRDLNVTDWVVYFFQILVKAQKETQKIVSFTLKKVQFFDTFGSKLNDRMLKAIKKMLDQGEDGFKGGMTSKKYRSINKTSKATASRDLQYLSKIGVLFQNGSGRSISYELNLALE